MDLSLFPPTPIPKHEYCRWGGRGGADPGGGVDWVSSHPPMGFYRQQEQ